jgi:hypothetical protein
MKTLTSSEAGAHVAQYNQGQRPRSVEQQVTLLLACVKAARRETGAPMSARQLTSYAETVMKLKTQHAELAAALGELNAKMAEAAQLLSEA